MIIRNIISNPDQPFDYFNDYQDTHNWLLGRLADPASDVALVFIALNTLEAGNVSVQKETNRHRSVSDDTSPTLR